MTSFAEIRRRISARADMAEPEPETDGDLEYTLGSGGVGNWRRRVGAPVLRGPFRFAHDTPGLAAGVEVYRPVDGEFLMDAIIYVDEAWNGTRPLCDVGTFLNDYGAIGNMFNYYNPTSTYGPMDLSQASSDMADPPTNMYVPYNGFTISGLQMVYQAWNSIKTAAAGAHSAMQLYDPTKPMSYQAVIMLPIELREGTPVKVAVSQDGSSTGASPGATEGAARLYLLTQIATPLP